MWKLQCLCLSVGLLVSCDKSPDTGKSRVGEESNSRTTRANRSQQKDSPSKKRDIAQSIRNALEIASTEERERVLGEIIRNAFETAPEIAMEALDHLPQDSPERANTLRHLTQTMIGKSTDEALAWAETLNSPTDVALVKEQIALSLSASDPTQAAKLVLEAADTSIQLSETAVQVLKTWVVTAPAAAAAWAQKLPTGEARKSGVKTVVTQWIQADSKEAFLWTSSIRDQTMKSEITRAMAEALVGTPDPIRNFLLEGAEPEFRTVIEKELNQVIKETEESVPDSPEE